MECTICLNPLEEDEAISSTECGHKFHSKCIFKSIAFKNFKCPNCRQELTSGPKENGNAARQEMIRTLIAEDIMMPSFTRRRIRPLSVNYSSNNHNGNDGENTGNEIGSIDSNNNNNNNNNNNDENSNVDNNGNSEIQTTIRSFASDLMRMHQNASTNTDGNTDGNNGLENHIINSPLPARSQTVDNDQTSLLHPVHTTVNSINTPITPITPFSYRRRDMVNIPNNIRRNTRILQDERMPLPNQMNSFTPYRGRRTLDVNMTEIENDQYVPPLLSNILSRNFIATSSHQNLDTHNSTNDYQTDSSTNTSNTSTNTSPDTLPFVSSVPQTVRIFMTEILNNID